LPLSELLRLASFRSPILAFSRHVCRKRLDWNQSSQKSTHGFANCTGKTPATFRRKRNTKSRLGPSQVLRGLGTFSVLRINDAHGWELLIDSTIVHQGNEQLGHVR
jgi:hypothetical protein